MFAQRVAIRLGEVICCLDEEASQAMHNAIRTNRMPLASYLSHRADVEYSKGTASRAWPRPWYLDQITGSGPIGFPKKDPSERQRGLPRLFAGARLADLVEQGRSGPILKREKPQDFKDYPQRSYATRDKRRGRHGRVWPMVRRKED